MEQVKVQGQVPFDDNIQVTTGLQKTCKDGAS